MTMAVEMIRNYFFFIRLFDHYMTAKYCAIRKVATRKLFCNMQIGFVTYKNKNGLKENLVVRYEYVCMS